MEVGNMNSKKLYMIFVTLPGFLFVLLFGIYWWLVIKYTVNMPFWDDYTATLIFLNNFLSSETFWEKVSLVFSQHNEHRIVFNRIVELLQLTFFGEINFSHQVFVGNIGWMLTAIICFKVFDKSDRSLWYFLPVVLMMTSITHYEIMLWAMGSLQNYYQMFFVFGSIYFLTGPINKKSQFAVYIFVPIALFTSGGSVWLIPIVLFHYILKKDYKNASKFAIYCCFLLWVYFDLFNYVRPGHHPNPYDSVNNLSKFFMYVACFLGSIFPNDKPIMAVSYSAFLFLLASLTLFFGSWKKNQFYIYSITFLIFSSLMAAITRSGLGIGQAFSSRYSIYSILFFVFVYLFCLNTFKSKYLLRTIGGLSIAISIMVFSLSLYKDESKMQDHSNKMRDEGIVTWFEKSEVKRIFAKSKKLGVYDADANIIFDRN